MTYTSTTPISTSGYSWGDFASQLLQGATTVAAAKYLSAAPTGQQIAAAAATPTQPTSGQAAPASAMISPALIVGGVVLVGLVAVLALRK